MKDEYIRKQDALDAFGLSEKTRKYGGDHSGYDTRMLYEIQDTIESLEPADVAPMVHGKWIDHDGNKVQLNEHGETCGTCFCSRCGEWLVASDEYAVKGYFCPNCGAKMDGGEA